MRQPAGSKEYSNRVLVSKSAQQRHTKHLWKGEPEFRGLCRNVQEAGRKSESINRSKPGLVMSQPAASSDVSPARTAEYSLGQLVVYALKLGSLGFGGPVALVGYMHRDLVERRNWISEADYKDGLALAQLAPGPLAAQLAIYLGFVRYRVLGATLVGLAFVLPSFFMVVAIGWAYVRFGGLPWMQAVFYGVGASVIGIIAMSAYKLTLKTIGKAVCFTL